MTSLESLFSRLDYLTKLISISSGETKRSLILELLETKQKLMKAGVR